MTALPRLLLCAAASGGGKTTVTCALLQALVDRGLNPAAFKCGPDYIDPMFHSEVIGAKSRNLDLFLLGEEEACRLLWENGKDCGVSIIEGVMGYYDGVALSSDASAYDLARAADVPAVLVLDGRGRALSAAAEVKGFASFRPDSHIRGVILNRVSPMLYPRLKAAIEAETGITVYGCLPNLPDCSLESRHLGLVTAAEVADLKEKLRRLSRQAEQTLDIDGLLALASSGQSPLFSERPAGEGVPPAAPPKGGNAVGAGRGRPVPRPRIAVARDRAFCFYYADGLRLLEQLGAELVEFSPLSDGDLPAGTRGIYLGGGYPELYAKELSANVSMRASLRAAIERGVPTVAECGGFLYLHAELEGADGQNYPMAGYFPHRAYRTRRLSRFGYVSLSASADNLLCARGESLPAHEFHYWESEDPGEAFLAQKPQSSRSWPCAYATPTLYAGFPHLHFCGIPDAARRFVAACAQYGTPL
ncbi:cobyrinate a,c-diamide synthase [Pseudoflavonifractor sp. BIOML-A6]|nr:cobyrinate a,c-diamide synthase [Pseudoflavonifractor sp. BIOML-A19]MTR71868.1 cobyrinate a,c-diamide synthase [Pseudoflavonifractor sp. BIOML-A18]MTS56237.1 cobyrinate a,c-diamide synthase [Pseudoflavonifractor sp. BIOML-A6]MTS70210.1 cobyrinate a,c-diamide synthase [Pseudoflavonifractor sp. BIOML-A8]